ncbi:MAG: flippase [Fusobacteria bacterium]|nr:flippase [Fusobacteriota bacterium]
MSIKKNYFYNFSYTIVNLLVPIVTMPYITRVLGDNNIGINGFTNSITMYFVFIGSLGISIYGNREVARVKDDKYKLSEVFIDLNIIQLMMAGLSIILFLIFVYFQKADLRVCFYAQGLLILSVIFDISWYFQGLEDFKKISIRNMIIRIINVSLIFSLVKNEHSLVIYIIITTGCTVIGQVFMWPFIKNTITLEKYHFEHKRVIVHLKKNSQLLMLQVFIQIYMYLGSTLLGYLSTIAQVAYYTLAIKIIGILLSLSNILNAVIMPRVSNLISKDKLIEAKECIYKSFKATFIVNFPLLVIILVLGKRIVIWYFGMSFLPVTANLQILALNLFIIPFGGIIGIQLLIPMGKERAVKYSPLLGLITNVILGVLIIPHFGSKGASITTLCTEFVGTIYGVFLAKKILNYYRVFSDAKKILIASFIMLVVCAILEKLFNYSMISLFILVVISMVVYIGMLIVLKEDVVVKSFKKILWRQNV